MVEFPLSPPKFWLPACHYLLLSRGAVEDTTFEAKAKDSKKIRCQGQGPTFRRQTLSRPRTEMVEAKAKDGEHNFSKLRSVNFQ